MVKPGEAGYPQHHPNHGRRFIEVHDHDVLKGRGVNIAQHPGNERFRALVKTRQDESYCTSFTTSEKRALAEEIVEHIRSLDPPGRFLKRSGRSNGSRGLSGPWEQLSHRECIKKTCQALRDCNRQDRQGYGAQVAAPNDVEASNEERAKTGRSLKEHAASVAAKAHPSTLDPHCYHLNPPLSNHQVPASPLLGDMKRPGGNILPTHSDSTRVSPSVDLAAQWLKKQRSDEPHAMYCTTGQDPARPMEPAMILSNGSTAHIHSTPAPYIAPVPVTTTPATAPHMHHGSNGHMGSQPYEESLAVGSHADSPQLPSPTAFHSVSTGQAPYSPVVLLDDHIEGHDVDPGDMEPTPVHGSHLDHQMYSQPYLDHHQSEQHLFHVSHLEHHGYPHGGDVLQSAAARAASSMGHISHHQRENSLTFSNMDDDGTHDSLHLSDL